MKTPFAKWAVAGLLLASLSACGQIGTGSSYEPGPVGVGNTVQELKGTPCACVEIPMHIPTEALGGSMIYGV